MDNVKLEEKYALPEGDYVVVTWDMVATGGNLHDDICQLVAYTPGAETFSQHVMPYHNMSLGTRRRHNLNVISTGRYRVLKDIRTNKTLVTKTIYNALKDFVEWLTRAKGTSDGIILVNHDTRHLITSILIEVVNNYSMLDQFCAIVKGFSNSYDIAEAKCDKAMKPHSIRSLSMALLSSEENALFIEGNNRTQAIYMVTQHILAAEAAKTEEADVSSHQIAKDIHAFCYSVEGVHKMTADLKAMQHREESLQPLFHSMRTSRSERQRSFNLQRLLARSNIDYEILNDIYKKGGLDAINEVLKCTMAQEHARELDELKHIFATHFDPEYKGEWKPERPVNDRPPRSFRRNSRSRRQRNSKNPSSPEAETNKTLPEGKQNTDQVTPTSPQGDNDATSVVPVLMVTNEENQTQAVTAGV